MRSTKNKGVDQSTPPSRSSLDSTPARGGLASPPHAIRRGSSMTNETAAEAGTAPGTLDTVYLKNVLLQFLEQKDRKHQMQLIPVLGMLLHFDRYVSAVRSLSGNQLTMMQHRGAKMDVRHLQQVSIAASCLSTTVGSLHRQGRTRTRYS